VKAVPFGVAKGKGILQIPPLRSPDFLSRLVALANLMRLSLKVTTGFADPRG
jgi:hypothetical protein